MNKKSLILAISLVLVLVLAAGAVGFTIAYLTSVANPVTNVFVAADFADVTLTETDTSNLDSNSSTHDYLVVPGDNIKKDPKVSFTPKQGEDNLVDAYVFVKMDAAGWITTNNTTFNNKIGGIDNGLSFSINSNWKYLKKEGNGYVYYTTVAAGTNFNKEIINGSTITVNSAIKESDLDTDSDPQAYSKIKDGNLTFSAYAIQQLGFNNNPTAAWTAVCAQSQE